MNYMNRQILNSKRIFKIVNEEYRLWYGSNIEYGDANNYCKQEVDIQVCLGV